MQNHLDRDGFFLGLGAQKCGTTWLTIRLQKHPEIWYPPAVREVHYFDSVAKQWNVKSTPFQIRELLFKMARESMEKDIAEIRKQLKKLQQLVDYFSNSRLDDRWYQELFEPAVNAKAFGEITPSYAGLREEGFSHMSKLAPQARVFLIMRNPIERAWSHVRHINRMYKEGIGKTSLESEQQMIKFVGSAACSNLTRYEITIDLMRKYFKPDRIGLFFFEDLVKNEADFFCSICAFLQVRAMPELASNQGKARSREKVSIPSGLRQELIRLYGDVPGQVKARTGSIPKEWEL